jgi:hypothetical protein
MRDDGLGSGGANTDARPTIHSEPVRPSPRRVATWPPGVCVAAIVWGALVVLPCVWEIAYVAGWPPYGDWEHRLRWWAALAAGAVACVAGCAAAGLRTTAAAGIAAGVSAAGWWAATSAFVASTPSAAPSSLVWGTALRQFAAAVFPALLAWLAVPSRPAASLATREDATDARLRRVLAFGLIAIAGLTWLAMGIELVNWPASIPFEPGPWLRVAWPYLLMRLCEAAAAVGGVLLLCRSRAAAWVLLGTLAVAVPALLVRNWPRGPIPAAMWWLAASEGAQAAAMQLAPLALAAWAALGPRREPSRGLS